MKAASETSPLALLTLTGCRITFRFHSRSNRLPGGRGWEMAAEQLAQVGDGQGLLVGDGGTINLEEQKVLRKE